VSTLFERDKPMSYLYQSMDNKLDLENINSQKSYILLTHSLDGVG